MHNADKPSFEQQFSTVQKECDKTESLSADFSTFISWFMTLMVKGRTLYCSVPAQYTPVCELLKLAFDT